MEKDGIRLKNVIDSPCGLRFYFEMLNLQSGYSRRVLLDTLMMVSQEEILLSYNAIEKYRIVFSKKENNIAMRTLQFKLQRLKDIEHTIFNLSNRSILDDIELFEIKHLSMLALDVKSSLDSLNIPSEIDSKISEAIEILDPDHLQIASFYIYDSYSKELAQLRVKIKNLPQEDDTAKVLSEKVSEIENKIRVDISRKLVEYAPLLSKTLHELAKIDIEISKSLIMHEMELCCPTITTSSSRIEGLFNPQVKYALEQTHRHFQNVDITYGGVPVVIIGANMGGKTVVLKSLALCQYLFQFGFPIPAKSAEMGVKEEIFLVCGDGQDSEKGLSSFASEMLSIDKVIKCTSKGEILALIDEPARSTNPIEGTALVSALVDVLSSDNITLVMTTHYNIDTQGCHRLKVKGLIDGKMDYSLIPSSDTDVPQEALNVAQSLNISQKWIDKAKNILDNN